MRLFGDENFAQDTAAELRSLNHDVLTARDAGRGNLGIPDPEVVAYAHDLGRIIVTGDRPDYIRLHRSGIPHSGIVVHTENPDRIGLAHLIHAALSDPRATGRFLARVHREGYSFDP